MTKTFRIENGVLEIFPGTREIISEQFMENSGVEKAVLPEGIEKIGAASFYLCENLREINIPSSVKTIGEGAFLYCSGLESIKLREGLEEIENLAFQCTGLRSVTVPESVKYIGEEAFFDCRNLAQADVLGKDTVIDDDAFGSNYSLVRGYIAGGFPQKVSPGSELQYSLLWASCPEKHDDEICARAIRFIQNNEMLVMERIFKYNNTAAMNGISRYRLLDESKVDGYVKYANDNGFTELTALLIKCKGEERNFEDEFEL